VLESERLRLRHRGQVRQVGAFVFVGALLVSFIALFLPHPAIRISGLHHGSSEQLAVIVAVLVAYLAAGACMGRWARASSRALPGFAVAAVAAVAVCAGACGFVLAVLDPEAGPERLERWFGAQRMTRPPAIDPEAVAALRPALVVLLVLVLPPLLTATGSVLARRDRLHLERLEDDVRLAAARPDWSPAAATRTRRRPPEPRPVAPPHPGNGPLAPLGPVLARRTAREQRRRAGVRYHAVASTVLLAFLAVLLVALPHGRGYGQSNLGTTVYALAAGFTTVATFLILHGWARTRAASPPGLLAALLAAGTVAAAGWWLTLRVLAGLRIRPEGLGYLRDPEVMADHDTLYSAPLVVAQGSWQQAALLAVPFVLPVVLAAWDARTARREFDRVRDLERLSP
jgi:hypothetical protein